MNENKFKNKASKKMQFIKNESHAILDVWKCVISDVWKFLRFYYQKNLKIKLWNFKWELIVFFVEYYKKK